MFLVLESCNDASMKRRDVLVVVCRGVDDVVVRNKAMASCFVVARDGMMTQFPKFLLIIIMQRDVQMRRETESTSTVL